MTSSEPISYLIDEEPMDTVMMTMTENPYDIAPDWLGALLQIGDDTSLERLPAGYLENPFVLGFAHSFCQAYFKEWFGNQKGKAGFVADVFKDLFGTDAAARYARALKLRREAHPLFMLGSDNAIKFFSACDHEEEFANDSRVATALKRAEEHVAEGTKATLGSEEYRFWIKDAQNYALYDVFFMDVLREQFPEKVEWRRTALERMPAPDLSDLDDLEEPSEGLGDNAV